MTNKRLFVVIFTGLFLGLAGSINVIYNHVKSTPYNSENSPYGSDQLNQKLQYSENQIRLVVNENNNLRKQIASLKIKISDLSGQLQQFADLDPKTSPNSTDSA